MQAVALDINKKSNKKWLWLLYLLGAALPLLVVLALMAVAFGFVISSVQEEPTNYDDMILSEIGENEIPAAYIPIYQKAGEEYGVPWILLAAIHRVETVFSTLNDVSSAGAIGHMQSMKCTWVGWSHPACTNTSLGDASIGENVYTDLSVISQYHGYGVDANGDGKADPHNLEDAVHSAAKNISKNMSGGIEGALYAYNHADWYVNDVMSYFNLYSDGYVAITGGAVEIKGGKAFPYPFSKRITSDYGPRGSGFHNGIDFSAPGDDTGKPIVAFADGKVIWSGMKESFGNLVIIQHENNFQTYYAHLKEKGINIGTDVKAGQTIGYCGNTGNSDGAHLHFETRVNGLHVNPRIYLADWIGSSS